MQTTRRKTCISRNRNLKQSQPIKRKNSINRWMVRKIHLNRNPIGPLQIIRRKIKRSRKQNRNVIHRNRQIKQLIKPKNQRMWRMETQSPKRRIFQRIHVPLNHLPHLRKYRPQKLHRRQIKRIRWLKTRIQQTIKQLPTSLI